VSVRIIERKLVPELLPMPACIDAMGEAMMTASRREVVMPARQMAHLPGGAGLLGVMAGACPAPATFGLKTISLLPGNPARGLPSIQGVIVLFDPATGAPDALIDANEVTAIRTAAVSALATRHLAREDAATLAIFGCGVQAASHLDAMRAVRGIERVLVWGRSAGKARAFCQAQAKRTGLAIEFVALAREAAMAADILCTVTASKTPFIEGAWLRPGAHLNLVGSHSPDAAEVDIAAIARARLIVDYRDFALESAGEIVQAIAAGAIDASHVRGELGQVVAGEVPGRTGPNEITVFKSLGLVVQDLVAADLILRSARDRNAGILCEI
jgi:ornithine cyclodeaminase